MSGFANARDLGGLHVDGGRKVRSGVLFRADAPLPGDEVPHGLTPWPPHTVIDFRARGELAQRNPLAESPVFAELPLAPNADLVAAARRSGSADFPMMYRAMLTDFPLEFARAVGLIAAADGPTLVHCTAGKDRTGVAIAIVLSAIGVPREAIVADYVATEDNMMGIVERMVASGRAGSTDLRDRILAGSRDLLRAPAVAVESVLDQLEAHPAGTAGWLELHGSSPAVLRRLKERLVED